MKGIAILSLGLALAMPVAAHAQDVAPTPLDAEATAAAAHMPDHGVCALFFTPQAKIDYIATLKPSQQHGQSDILTVDGLGTFFLYEYVGKALSSGFCTGRIVVP